MPGYNRLLQIEHILSVYLNRDYVINTSNKVPGRAVHYITNHFRCQNYFHIATNCKHRITLIIYRTKNQSLPNVIQGRGRNRRSYNKRICPACNVLGDEYHCLFECENTRHIMCYPAITLLGQICLFLYLRHSQLYVRVYFHTHTTTTKNCITLLYHCSRFI